MLIGTGVIAFLKFLERLLCARASEIWWVESSRGSFISWIFPKTSREVCATPSASNVCPDSTPTQKKWAEYGTKKFTPDAEPAICTPTILDDVLT
jgi:hypothetical protein